jgi:DNA-binding response OmpR family regulator/TolB-like protein
MGGSIDVLMIEDDGADAYLVESLLEKEPVAANQLQIERSCSVAEGLDHLAMRHVDSVLLDLNLPDSRGHATVERIRGQSAVPIVVLTSSDEIEMMTAVLQAGAQEYLVKGEASGACLWRAIKSSIERASLPSEGQDRATLSTPRATLFEFDGFELEMEQRELRLHGEPIPIHLKPLNLLHYLVRNRHRVVSKDEVLREVWRGVLVSDAALASALKELRQALGDDAAHQRFVRTLRGFGYQFIAPVCERPAIRPVRVRSLALLPLACLSTDPKAGHLAVGMNEALIRELVTIESLRLVSRESAAKFLSSEKSLPELARELGVDFVLCGSVARSGECTRVSVQLLDAHEDRHTWAGHYDRASDDLLSIESDLARAVARQIRVLLAGA